jgi:predicted enzyme related to lactoylglutathione lyase
LLLSGLRNDNLTNKISEPYLNYPRGRKTAKGAPMANRICFVELPVGTAGPAKLFYTQVFGFAMTDFGPTYSCTMTGDVDLGLQADAKEASRAPLPVIQVESLEATEALVKRAGGVVTKAAFSFPGGRRFHFRDPAGNELAAMQPD